MIKEISNLTLKEKSLKECTSLAIKTQILKQDLRSSF